MEISAAAAAGRRDIRQQYIAIEVPIYSDKVRRKRFNYHLTWMEIIENMLGECDGIEDCTLEKILRSPEHDYCSI